MSRAGTEGTKRGRTSGNRAEADTGRRKGPWRGPRRLGQAEAQDVLKLCREWGRQVAR